MGKSWFGDVELSTSDSIWGLLSCFILKTHYWLMGLVTIFSRNEMSEENVHTIPPSCFYFCLHLCSCFNTTFPFVMGAGGEGGDRG